jgi:hypothetical protein
MQIKKNIMKNTFIAITLFTMLNCKAQTTIIPRYNHAYGYGDIKNAYYKDDGNFLNQYEGTWEGTMGNKTLKIKLQKKERIYEDAIGIPFYTDYIVGEYQYIDGVEKLNTLSNLLVNYTSMIDYGLYGNIQYPNNIYPKCLDCFPGEMRLSVDINEPIVKEVDGLEARMLMRRYVDNGVVKLKIWFNKESGSFGETYAGVPTTITKHTIPYGEYILTKVP